MRQRFSQLRRQLFLRHALLWMAILVVGLILDMFFLQHSTSSNHFVFIALWVILAVLLAWTSWLLLDQAVLRVVKEIGAFAAQLSGGYLPKRLGPTPETAVDRLVADLQDYAAEMVRARRTSRDFLAAVSHQLSQPLTALRGTLELALLKRATPEEYRIALEESLEQADRLVRLSRTLRELAESEQLSEVTEEIELRAVVEEIAQDMGPLAESRGIRFITECATPLKIRGGLLRLRQAVLNIVDCVIQYTPSAGTIQVALLKVGTDACLKISATDFGLSTADLERFFDPFHSGHAMTGEVEETGLGMAVAKRVIEAVGGKIEVDAEDGRVCAFRIHLPLTEH